jgi:hypothetical protein
MILVFRYSYNHPDNVRVIVFAMEQKCSLQKIVVYIEKIRVTEKVVIKKLIELMSEDIPYREIDYCFY